MNNNEKTILNMLSQADVIYIGDSPILGGFQTEPENGILEFIWEDQDGEYDVTIPEKNLKNAKFDDGGDVELVDINGDTVILQCYTLKQIKPMK